MVTGPGWSVLQSRFFRCVFALPLDVKSWSAERLHSVTSFPRRAGGQGDLVVARDDRHVRQPGPHIMASLRLAITILAWSGQPASPPPCATTPADPATGLCWHQPAPATGRTNPVPVEPAYPARQPGNWARPPAENQPHAAASAGQLKIAKHRG